ncbi:hypothetical protein [Diaphorobacter caeni]|uniref:hypothetical protein n=1 Tax=Diaphorobacter caeni TaxID=2784387 RepID=UPI00188EE1A7|nr:hypothetical protein [Diaphorobacter caeni]MBF5002929.1 hypothetical protein [Diaphorobacter caeni]
MLITLDEYERAFHWEYRFHFRDAVVRDRNIFSFIVEPSLTEAQERDERKKGGDHNLRPKGVRIFNRSAEPGKMWSGRWLQNWEAMVCGSAKNPLNQVIQVEASPVYPSMERRVLVSGSGPAYQDLSLGSSELEVGDARFIRGRIGKIKEIDGYAYVAAGGRSFGRRLGKGQWESFSHLFAHSLSTDAISEEGFRDFDGWSAEDIYLVGGLGDLWHFDGASARRISLSYDYPLHSVCCGGDGRVYVSGMSGDTWVGRGDQWTRIRSLGLSLPLRDMVWYEDRAWGTNDHGVYWIQNDTLQIAELPPEASVCAGNLSAADGVLLIAGLGGAVFRENGRWTPLVLFDDMERIRASKA